MPQHQLGSRRGFTLLREEKNDLFSSDDEEEELEQTEYPEYYHLENNIGNRSPKAFLLSSIWKKPKRSAEEDYCIKVDLGFLTPTSAIKVPYNRWDVETLNLAGLEKTKRFGAFIPNVEDFDDHLFSISSHEAIYLDPQQRILLECSWLAVLGRDALEHLHSFSVSVGVSYNEYFLTNVFNGATSSYLATSGTLSSICGRISYQLGCKGPSVSLDTACSSSLVGLHLSLSSFMPQGWNKALCCGVNLMIRPQASWVLSLAGMLCDDARCKTLDTNADGYGRAESCIAHHLENSTTWLSGDAQEKNQNLVYIAGTSVGQDGRSSSLTAPNGHAQQQVIKMSFLSSNIDPSEANFLELHGTGTKLGDPIEVGAAADIFCAHRKTPIRVQASKSHMLHSEPAAGAAGLSWMFKSLTMDPRASFLPRLTEINAFVIRSLGQTSVGALSMLRQPAAPAAAIQNCMITGSISSFAYQGTNSHAIASGSQPEPFTTRRPMKWRRRHFWWQIPMVPIIEHFLSYTRLDEAILFEGSIGYNESYMRHFKVANREIVCPTFLASAYQRFLLGLFADEDWLGLESTLFHYVPLKNILKDKLLFECRVASSRVQISSNQNQMKILLSSFVKVLNLRENLSKFRMRTFFFTDHCSQYASKTLNTSFSRTDAHVSEPKQSGNFAIDAVFQSALVLYGCHDQAGLVAISARILHQSFYSINLEGYCESKAEDIAQAGFQDGTKIFDAKMGRFSSEASVSKFAKIGVHSFKNIPKTFQKKIAIEDEIKEIFLGFIEQPGDQIFSSLGLDSISSLEVREILQNRFSLRLPATIVYDYPSISQISDYIWGLFSSSNPGMKIHHGTITHAGSNVVGILAGTEFGPGMHAKGTLTSIPSEFLKKTDFCRLTPISRWDTDEFHSAKFSARYESSLKFGCWLESPEFFDRLVMEMSEQESLGLDPQCRLLLECSFQLTHPTSPSDPGYMRKSIGVYVGCVWSEYNLLIEQYTRDAQTFHLIGNGLHFISGRISYTLGLGGPCIGLNTACSSSLVALHLAKKALDQNEVRYGLSAGSNIMLLPLTSLNLASLGSLSSTGRCKTLDSSADGYGRGEESCAIILGTVENDSERVIGVVLGSNCNQDGRSSSLTSPNGPSQTQLLQKTLREIKNYTIDSLALLNLHGTGTQLGDPIEIGALANAFEQPHEKPIAIASAKTAIGHSEGSAGMQGALSTLSSLICHKNAPVCNLRRLNIFLLDILENFSGNFSIQRECSGRAVTRPEMASSSSFGMSGTNANVSLISIDLHEWNHEQVPWRRQYLWPEMWDTDHKLSLRQVTALKTSIKIHAKIDGRFSYLLDHVVNRKPIMPGAEMLELASLVTRKFSLKYSKTEILVNSNIMQSLELQSSGTFINIDVETTSAIHMYAMKDKKMRTRFFSTSFLPESKVQETSKTKKLQHIFIAHSWWGRSCIGLVASTPEKRDAAVSDASIHLGPATHDDGIGSSQKSDSYLRVIATAGACRVKSRHASSFTSVTKRLEEKNVVTNHFCFASGSKSAGFIIDLVAKPFFPTKSINTTKEGSMSEYVTIWSTSKHHGICSDQRGENETLLYCDNDAPLVRLTYRSSIGQVFEFLRQVQISQSVLATNVSRIQIFQQKTFFDRSITHSHHIPHFPDIIPALTRPFHIVASNERRGKQLFQTAQYISQGRMPRLGAEFSDQLENFDGRVSFIPKLRYMFQQDKLSGLNSDEKLFSCHKSYVLTGGMGALGSLVCSWIHSCQTMVTSRLIGRTGKFPTNSSPAKSLIQFACFCCIMGDVSSREDVLSTFDSSHDLRQVNGIMHAGGAVDGKSIQSISPSNAKSILSGKSSGGTNLHISSSLLPLGFTHLFSSIAAFGGVRGQAAYAASNGMLDEFGSFCQISGVPSLSVQWGNWSGNGMAANDHNFLRQMRSMGLGLISSIEGLESMRKLLYSLYWSPKMHNFKPVIMANIFIWNKIDQSSNTNILDEIVGSNSTQKRPKMLSSDKSSGHRISAENIDNLNLERETMIAKIISNIQKYIPGVQEADPIGEIDSLDSQSLRSSLSSAFGIQFPATLIYDYPTALDIAAYIEEKESRENDNSIGKTLDMAEETKEVIAKTLQKIVDKDLLWKDSVLDFGLDSLEVVKFSNDLSDYFQINISPTWMFDYPTIDSLQLRSPVQQLQRDLKTSLRLLQST
eukprot:jgi/Picsp_1/2673/NSC_00903-R1_polyketide synthase